MRKWILAAALALTATAAQAQSGFCEGFKAGWRAAFENRRMIVAITPICPIPPVGGNSFQAGYEIGLTEALEYIAANR